MRRAIRSNQANNRATICKCCDQSQLVQHSTCRKDLKQLVLVGQVLPKKMRQTWLRLI